MTNFNIPYIRAMLRLNFVSSETGFVNCEIYAARAALNKPITFHCMLECGVLYHNLPINAFAWKKEAPAVKLNEVSYWDSQSSNGESIVYWYLQGCEADFKSKDGNTYRGKYLFTIENIFDPNNPYGYAHDASAKCYHLLKLDTGNFALSPNTFLRWHCGDNFVDHSVEIPKLKSNELNESSEL